MAEITTAMVKELREVTGAGILESRNALQEAQGNMDKAIQLLRERGLAKAAKKQDRTANQGVVITLIENDGRHGAMVELNCETDFVARNERFQTLANTLVNLVANRKIDSVDALLAESVNGKTVKDMLTEAVAAIGENIQVRRVARFEAPEGHYITEYTHMGGRIGVLLQVAGASPELAHDIALQVAASAPRYLTAEEAPAEMIESERAIYRAQMADEKKPDHIKEKILQGKVEKYLDEIVLLRQPFIKDPNKTVQQLMREGGDGAQVTRFARFELGAE